jgi:hypothetical protein
MKKQNKNNKLAFKKANVVELTNKTLSQLYGGNINNEELCTGNTLSSCDTVKAW